MIKKRLMYLAAVLTCILLGLSSRRYGPALPSFVTGYAGDILWAAMVYYGFRFLLPASPIRRSALWAFLFSWCIEFSQLYQAEWIRQLRAHRFAALVLGQGFLWSDLLCYTAGIAFALCMDYY
ncbi:MAG: DUF2809 domain-containing protein, partial [Bacteroides sp.]|nr:DUF2809 domain-containing protein [Bacteroides sp.]